MSVPNSTLPMCRDWNEFTNRNRFSWPKSNNHWMERSDMNLGYYRGNYTYIGLSIIIVAALSSPIFYVIYALFFYMLKQIRSQTEVHIGELHLDRPQAGLLLVVVTLFLLLVFGGDVFFKAIFLALVIVLAHATFHKRPAQSKVASFWKDLWGTEESASVETMMTESEGMVSNMMDQVYKYLDAAEPHASGKQPPAYTDVTGGRSSSSSVSAKQPEPRRGIPNQRTRAATESVTSKKASKESVQAEGLRPSSVAKGATKSATKSANPSRPASSMGTSVLSALGLKKTDKAKKA